MTTEIETCKQCGKQYRASLDELRADLLFLFSTIYPEDERMTRVLKSCLRLCGDCAKKEGEKK